MGWFSEASLRAQWRFAQAILAVPLFALAISLVLLIGLAVIDPGEAWLRVTSQPLGRVLASLAVPALCWAVIERIERGLRASPPLAVE